jgi:hypothetical protein
MGYNRTYLYNKEKFNGHEPCDILLQLYETDHFKTISLRADQLVPWQICDALNRAYEEGRKDAKREIRTVLEIKD